MCAAEAAAELRRRAAQHADEPRHAGRGEQREEHDEEEVDWGQVPPLVPASSRAERSGDELRDAVDQVRGIKDVRGSESNC